VLAKAGVVPMGAAMSTFPYALAAPAAVVEPGAQPAPVHALAPGNVPAPADGPAPVDAPLILAPELASPSRRWRAVLAPLLPTLFLLAFCVAGLADPPGPSAGESGASSRLHVPAEAPRYVPSVPLTR
jgi:hypothetical protein